MHPRWNTPIWLFLLILVPTVARAGGPILVGGPAVGSRPAFGIDGQPFIWNPAKMPIQYRLDPGPMATNPSGVIVINNATGAQRVQNMFATWQAVSTANISYSNVGPLLPAGSYTGGDLRTAQQFNDMLGSCKSGAQSPIVFDADGSIISALGLPPEVIGFTNPCAQDPTTGYFVSSAILMNGRMQDGIDSPGASPPNFELTANQFDEAITHEIGHFSGLDHSQINLDLLTENVFPCNLDELAGLPLMFPAELCQARKDAGLPVLAPDDIAWISTLYPSTNFASNYGSISGTIFFGDGVSAFQGANVIGRLVDDPSTEQDESRRVAVSAVSGFLFTGNPGQNVTGNNASGAPNGSRNSHLIGFYRIAVPPGTYTVEVEAIFTGFVGASSIGPLPLPPLLPGPAEFWNQDESAFDFPLQRDTITIHAGDNITGIDIILNSPLLRFDQFEDSGALFDAPVASPIVSAKEALA
jgi:hypothetical protein